MKNQLPGDISKRLEGLKGLDLFSIPLISQYRCLVFDGLADGSNMTPRFDTQTLNNKIMVIKSIRLIPYASNDIVDFYVSDGGALTFKETIPINIRLNNILDQFNERTGIRILINDVPVPFLTTVQTAATGFYPADLWLDNIFYKYEFPVNNMTVSVFSTVVDDPSNPAASVIVNMVVLIECYLI